MIGFPQVANEPTHISRSQIDHCDIPLSEKFH